MYRTISNMYDHESLVGKESPIYGEVVRYDAFFTKFTRAVKKR